MCVYTRRHIAREVHRVTQRRRFSFHPFDGFAKRSWCNSTKTHCVFSYNIATAFLTFRIMRWSWLSTQDLVNICWVAQSMLLLFIGLFSMRLSDFVRTFSCIYPAEKASVSERKRACIFFCHKRRTKTLFVHVFSLLFLVLLYL